MIRILTTSGLVALTLLAAASVAAAQTPGAAPAPSPAPTAAWSFVVGAGTDNRSKDASKSDGDPYVWGTATWQSADRLFYAGPGFETIRSSTGSELELKAAAGIRPKLAGFAFDLNAAWKYQVDANPGTDHDNWEFTGDVKRSAGPASGRVRLQYSPDGAGTVRAWSWVEARVGWDFTPALNGSIGLGRREQDGGVDYTGWDAGFTYALAPGIDTNLRYYATDANTPGAQYADGFAASVSFTF